MSQPIHQVTDTNGTRYRLVRRLGRGGQGAVFEVEGGSRAVKVLDSASSRNRSLLRNQLAAVRRLDLAGLEIARPLEMLREPDLGYVMELVTGMEPLQHLTTVPKGTPSVGAWYHETGSLRRRLRLLARTGDIFATLHGKGLAYVDSSPQNIYISEDLGHVEVRLIDADNIHFASSSASPSIYTPGFGAPEVLAGISPANSLTDAHAFSVIAFQVLSLVHPLIGDDVANGPPEREDDALAGDLPWIDSADDPSNRTSLGIPRRLVLSPMLANLATRAFEKGLLEPQDRPGVAEWADRLHGAADGTLVCQSCRATFYVTASTCPWCGTPRPPFVTADFHVFEPASSAPDRLLQNPPGAREGARLFARVGMTDGEATVVTDRLACGSTGLQSTRPVVEVRWTGKRVSVRSLDDKEYVLESPSGGTSTSVTARGSDVPIESGQQSWSLHLGDAESLHRVVRFSLRSGEQA